MLLTFFCVLIIIGTLLRPARPLADLRLARWFHIASYRGGTVAHLTPMRDGLHTEDEYGDCECNPQASRYSLAAGRTGILFVHRVINADTNRKTR